jgi:hypothetical protein
MNLEITKNTKFWLYPVSGDNFNYFMKYKGDYITFFGKNNISSQDIIIVYSKELKNRGFGALLQISGDLALNTTNNIKIFKNDNLNKYRAKVSIRKNFIPLIKIKDVIDNLKISDSSFKNVQSFSGKYLKGENGVILLQNHGQLLTNKLIELSSKKDEKNSQGKKSSKNSSDNDSDSDRSEKEVSGDESSDDESSDDKSSDDKSPDDKSSDDESSDDESSDDESSDETHNNNRGFIPIMVIPCKDFKIEKIDEKNRGDAFMNHYKKCNKCEVTNNNNRELCSIVDKAKIDFFDLETEKHAFFNPALDCYFGMEKYEVLGATQFPFIRVVYINNKHALYDQCILITWCE